MAKSYALSTGDGVLATVMVPFPYISRDHVRLYSNGVEVPFSWISYGMILAATPPAFDAQVLVKRVTPRDVALVDYADGDVLTAFDLDLDSAQALFVAQEAHDALELERYFSDTYDGALSVNGGKRITNVGYPENDTDAATKLYVDRVAGGLETPVENAVTAAQAAAAAALLSAGGASTSATNAALSALNAGANADEAATKANEAALSAIASDASADLASVSATNAASSASSAAGSASAASSSATLASTKATEAGASAAAAGTSATNAATSATNAGNSASAASTSASLASTKATEAGTSASAAATSASNAAASKDAANTAASNASSSASSAASSATAAGNSASNAATSATNAANSATAAGGSASAAAGSASSASTSATNAGNSATAANTAKVAAESARDAASGSASAAASSASSASTSATNAATSATAADTAKVAAQTARSGAESARDTAVTAKDTAVSSAATATTKATDAANSASAAGTSAGAASTSASTATTQANNAAASATAASNSALTAQASANRLIPERPEYPANFTGSNGAGSPEAIATLASGTNVAVSGKGNVRQFTASTYVATKGVLPIVAGRSSRYDAEMRVTMDGTANTGWHGFQVLDANFNPITNYAFLPSQTVADGWVTRSQTLSHSTILTSNPTAAYLRAWVLGGANSSAVSSGATWQLNFLRLADATDTVAAAASASAAAASSASASTSAASASSSATLAASVGRGALTRNVAFTEWPSAGALPTAMLAWNNATWSRVTGDAQTSPWAWRDAPAAGAEGGPYTTDVAMVNGRSYVVVGEFTLESGTLVGAGLTVGGVYSFPFSSHPDSEGNTLGAGTAGRTYFFSRMFKATADSVGLNTHGMTAWAGFGQSIATARTIVWRQLYLRAATDAEIAAGRALSNTATLSASITTLQAVDTDINGRLNASYGLTVNAGGRIAGMKLLSNGAASSIAFEADEFTIAATGATKKPFRVAGGRVEIDEALIRNLQVYPNDASTIAHRVAVLPKLYSGADGATITFPGTYGSGIPYIRWAGGTPPALAAGESFEIVPVSAGPTGFTVRAKKFLPGVTTVQNASAGTNVGGTPQWRAHKPTAQDADAGRYFYKVSGQAVLLSIENQGTVEAPAYYAEYVIAIGLWYRPAGGSWTKARTEEFYLQETFGSTPPGTKTFSNVSLPVDLPALGQDSDYEFGVSREAPYTGASITAFPGVTYNTTSTSSVTALSGEWTFEVLPPT